MVSHNYPTITVVISIFTLTLTTAAGSPENSPSSGPHISPAPSFYDVLNSNGLPIGIFPKGISEFSFDADSGNFELHLLPPSPCDAKFETRVRYQCNMTGIVSYGKIANLSGVAAQELFLWLPVMGIQVDIPSSGLIYFDIGVISKQFSLSFFETPKDCNAMEEYDGRNDSVVFLDDRSREPIVENDEGKFMKKHSSDEEQRAIS